MPDAPKNPASDAGDLVRRRTVLPVEPAVVWQALVEPDELEAWWGEGSHLDATPGGRARLAEPGADDRDGRVVEVRPERRLRLDVWPAGDDDAPATRITIELEPCPFGTVVEVTEAPLAEFVLHPTRTLTVPAIVGSVGLRRGSAPRVAVLV